MATPTQLDKLENIIVRTETEELIKAAVWNDVRNAVAAAGVKVQVEITQAFNKLDAEALGNAILDAGRAYYEPTAQTTADTIINSQSMTFDQILKYLRKI